MFPLPRMLEYGNIAPAKGNIKDFQVTSGAAPYNTYILYNNGQLYGYGSNAGILGDGSTTAVATWELLATDVKMFSAGCTIAVYITNDNKAFATGRLNDAFPGNSYPTSVAVWTDVSTGFRTSSAPIDISTVKILRVSQLQSSVFITNQANALMSSGINTSYLTGKNVATGGTPFQAIATRIVDVRSSRYCTIALKDDFTAHICGMNTNYGIGRGTNVSTSYGGLTQISAAGQIVTSVFVNETQSSYIADGSIYTAGKNNYTDGATAAIQWPNFTMWGNSVMLPNDIPGNNIVHLKSNALYGWGDNISLQDGIGSTSYITKETACLSTEVLEPSKISNISSHRYATYIVVNNEKVYAAGLNTYTLLPATTGVFTSMPLPQ